MAIGTISIGGADKSVTNVSGNNYVSTLQATTARSFLYKLTISPCSGFAADVYVWAFDTAAGSAASAAPVAVRFVPAGYADTWDLAAGGSLFPNGIYFAVSTVAPTNATTTVTDAGSNKVILKAEVRVK